MDNKKIKIIASILSAIVILIGAYITYKETGQVDTNKINEAVNVVMNEVVVSAETQDTANKTIEATEKGQEVATTETIKATTPEEEIVDEGAIESDAVVEQENISYDGDITGKGTKLLGKYQGLTYYSQADYRWGYKPYTITGNKKQTIKTSGCGATSASMVVSSSKGAILPPTMAKLFVDNGYRTANNGTAWSAYPFVADYFGFKDYKYTTNIDTAIQQLRKGYFIIASCGSGLFTTNGHYIVLAGIDKNTIKIYDPYVYAGKFNTVTRRGKVTVKGNTVYCSINNFKKYANYKSFWCYSNDKGSGNTKKVTTTKKNTTTKKTTKTTTKKVTKKSTVGKTKTLKKKCTVYSKSNLKGKKYTYKKNTKVVIKKNVNAKVDKVKVKATGRTGYLKVSNYK